MRYRFNVGDRVRVLDEFKIKVYTTNWAGKKNVIGKEGIIINRSIIENHLFYRIKFDDRKFNKYDSCIFDERELEPVGIHITFSIMERRVISRVYNSKGVIAESEARCHPDDEFDLKTGIRIALDRLLAKVSLYNGKVICVENDGPIKFDFTKGKIYNIVEGEIKDDCGKIPFKNTTSLDQFDKVKGLSFIPLVE